jgi:hypothetical protein
VIKEIMEQEMLTAAQGFLPGWGNAAQDVQINRIHTVSTSLPPPALRLLGGGLVYRIKERQILKGTGEWKLASIPDGKEGNDGLLRTLDDMRSSSVVWEMTHDVKLATEEQVNTELGPIAYTIYRFLECQGTNGPICPWKLVPRDTESGALHAKSKADKVVRVMIR